VSGAEEEKEREGEGRMTSHSAEWIKSREY